MKIKYLLSVLLTGAVLGQSLAQDLDFANTLNAPGGTIYPNGAKSFSYTNVGSPATNVDITTSGVTSFAGTTQPRPRADGLQSQMNFADNTNCVTFKFTFSPGVSNLSFRMFEVDRGMANTTTPVTYTYEDQVTISGKIGATNVVYPTIGTTTYNAVSGANNNIITGQGTANTTSNTVTFSGYISEVTITYCNGANAQAAPPTQSVTIGDMSWSGPLPVDLVGFSGKQIENQAVLSWQTASEINSERFDVERSTDALAFERIGSVQSVGESNGLRNYLFIDPTPVPNANYYRLKQWDKNGVFAYSNLISVLFEQNGFYWNVTNPVSQNTIYLQTNAQDFKVELYNILGQEINLQTQTERPNEYRLATNRTLEGLYVLRMWADGKAHTHKLYFENN